MVVSSLAVLNKSLKMKETEIEIQIVEMIQQATILVVIFYDFLMFYQIFLSPQVKRLVIISNKHCKYDYPHQLQNDLRLRKILGN